MPRKDDSRIDVLILGEHPSTYLAAALLAGKSPPLKVVHGALPEPAGPDRLVLLNANFFALHPLLASLVRKLDLKRVYGVQFFSDNRQIHSAHRGKAMMAFVTPYAPLRKAMIDIARRSGAVLLTPKCLQIHSPDETGLDVLLDGQMRRAKALILGGTLPENQAKLLGLGEELDREAMVRYSFIKPSRAWRTNLGARPLLPMSLDLKATLDWAWLLPYGRTAQACVMQPLHGPFRHEPLTLLRHWMDLLRQHGIIDDSISLRAEDIVSMDIPAGGALAQEGVADRTLLIGPGGGFYSAAAEDIYPNCWSALFAVEVMRKALREPHLQDALQQYRQKWRTTLGEYLRLPQQNLRYLLPLIYRNQVMTSRLAEAILQGKGMVR